MKIGIAKEIKKHEYRVGATSHCVSAYVAHGHTVMVEKGAGLGAGYSDEDYEKTGAVIEPDKKKLFDNSEMIVKVKEPLPSEYALLHKGQILFTYLHLASSRELTEALLQCGIRGVAYETIQLADGRLPCLIPMSEIAGRLASQEGAKYLEKTFGGRGILLGGIPGVKRGKVVIIGGGVVGINAARIAVGLGAEVTILDISTKRLAYLDDIFGYSLQTLFSNETNIFNSIVEADVVIGAVLLPGASTPKLIKREHLKHMKKGSVIVDVAVDQGGCAETTVPTTHDDPTYIVDDVVHYCVSNIPGVVALTSTLGLTNCTLAYGLKIADMGIEEAVKSSPDLRKGVNLWDGKIAYEAVANSLNMSYSALPI
ncbi:Alanine dehydrogenase [subsurface metagenome]